MPNGIGPHEHKWGQPVARSISRCQVGDCTEWRISSGSGWREFSLTEGFKLLNDLVVNFSIMELLTLVDGDEHAALERARTVLGYD